VSRNLVFNSLLLFPPERVLTRFHARCLYAMRILRLPIRENLRNLGVIFTQAARSSQKKDFLEPPRTVFLLMDSARKHLHTRTALYCFSSCPSRSSWFNPTQSGASRDRTDENHFFSNLKFQISNLQPETGGRPRCSIPQSSRNRYLEIGHRPLAHGCPFIIEHSQFRIQFVIRHSKFEILVSATQ